jgi:hypothetical protein
VEEGLHIVCVAATGWSWWRWSSAGLDTSLGSVAASEVVTAVVPAGSVWSDSEVGSAAIGGTVSSVRVATGSSTRAVGEVVAVSAGGAEATGAAGVDGTPGWIVGSSSARAAATISLISAR